MEITKYKDIIIVDNFITDEENRLFVSLIERPRCYEQETYWRFLANDSRVAPFTLNYYGEKLFNTAIDGVDDININNAYIDIKKRILNLLEGKFKVEHSVIEKFSNYVPYICDKEMPIDGTTLGVPSAKVDDHSGYTDYTGEWGLTLGGTRKYVARIFINNDFEGGNLTFPKQKLDIQPLKDRLVLYPCNSEHVYGVRNINGGSFYLTFWFNKG